MKVLLLNPPGSWRYSRDYFCGNVVKADYFEHPVDLLFLSGILKQEHQVSFIDCIVRGLSPDAALDAIMHASPDAIVFLSGLVSFHEDSVFMKRVRSALPMTKLIGMGDIFLEPEALRESPWIDATIRDFTSSDLLAWLSGRFSDVSTMDFRLNEKIVSSRPAVPARDFSIPTPDQKMFLSRKYKFPFARFHPFATLLTDFGCPFHCRFCIYGTLGYRRRGVGEVRTELSELRKLSVREIFVKDQCFGADRERGLALCRTFAELGPFSWSCFMRADRADREVLSKMRDSGCHTIMFGVESANSEILKAFDKGMTPADNERAIGLCRDIGINTVGIFIMGFPGEDEAGCRKTLEFALRLDCDYASFNLFVPKPATRSRADLRASGRYTPRYDEILDQSGIAAIFSFGGLPVSTLEALRAEAIRRFYGRPSYLFKRILKVRTLFELKMLAASAKAVCGGSLLRPILERMSG